MREFFLIIGSYLLGSLNFAIILSKAVKKTDIRQKDHAGASGVFRQHGALLGVTTLLLDILKGILVGLACQFLPVPGWAQMLAGLAVVAGHNWPLYFQFSGGGGLTTLFGFLIVLLPLDTAIFTAGTLLLSVLFWKTDLGKMVRVLGRPIPAAAIFGVLAFFIFALIKYGFIWYGLMILLLGIEMALRRLVVLLKDTRRVKEN